jgi:hypothetical protein
MLYGAGWEVSEMLSALAGDDYLTSPAGKAHARLRRSMQDPAAPAGGTP